MDKKLIDEPILFRGKAKIFEEEWIFGYYYYDNNKDSHIIYDGIKGTEVKPETVSQYIGFKDFNDINIFGKDIVEMHPSRGKCIIGEVVWLQQNCKWVIRVVSEQYQYYTEIDTFDAITMRVIGNCIDNRSLLDE